MGRTVARNLNIRLEIARVREARARLGFAWAEQFPTIDLQIDAARQQESAGLGGFGGEGSDIDDGLGGEGSEAGGVGGEHISAFSFFSIAGLMNFAGSRPSAVAAVPVIPTTSAHASASTTLGLKRIDPPSIR